MSLDMYDLLDEAHERIAELEDQLWAHKKEIARIHYWLSCIAKASMDIEDMTDAALKPYYITLEPFGEEGRA